MSYLLIVFIPGRSTLGVLAKAARKHGVQLVVGCAEPPVRARYAERRGLVFTLSGWTPAAERKGRGKAPARVTLPADVLGLVDEVAGAPGGDTFELVLLPPGGALAGEAPILQSKLAEPLKAGCCYAVRAQPRFETELW